MRNRPCLSFAPLHTVRVAPSFPGGLELASEIRPELFVLDLDPPPVGAIPFLIKLQADYPESRILCAAAGTSVTLCAARGKSATFFWSKNRSTCQSSVPPSRT